MSQKQEEKRMGKVGPSDFSNEYRNLKVFIKTINETFEGKLINASKFWLKVETNDGLFYINKGQVIYIKPLEKPIEKPEVKETKKEIPKMPWLR
jgi:hypothetical protein